MQMQEHVPLRDKTTLQIGGTARYFISIAHPEELTEAVACAQEKRLPFVLLGGGSNVLISDKELNAVVLQIAIRGIDWSDSSLTNPVVSQTAVTAGAGESWDGLVAEAVRRGLWGIENLSGIPGSVGAAPIQNIGAYGAELKDVLEWVEAFDTVFGEIKRLSTAECTFGYRDSIFKKPEGKQFFITRVALRLRTSGKPNLSYKDMEHYFVRHKNPTLSEIRQAVLEIRSKKFPDVKQCGTAGSFFKNPIISQEQFDELKKKYPELPGFPVFDSRHSHPYSPDSHRVKVSLAWILDHICGLKGYKKGNVALFERQPIVLVNTGNATAGEVKNFAEDITRRVKEATGISIEYEVQELT